MLHSVPTNVLILFTTATSGFLSPPSLAVNIGVGSNHQILTAELSFEPSFIKTTTQNSKLFAPNLESFSKDKSSSYKNSVNRFNITLRSFSVESNFGYDDLELFGMTIEKARFVEPLKVVQESSLHDPILKHSASLTINPFHIAGQPSEAISKLLESRNDNKITISARANENLATLTPGEQVSNSKLEPAPYHIAEDKLILEGKELSFFVHRFPIEGLLVNIDQPALLLPPNIYNLFYSSYISQSTPLDGYPVIPCEDISSLPAFKFQLMDNQKFEIPPQSYVSKTDKCVVLIAQALANIPVAMVGVPFFYDRSITFDYDDNTLTIGNIGYNLESSSSSKPPAQNNPNSANTFCKSSVISPLILSLLWLVVSI